MKSHNLSKDIKIIGSILEMIGEVLILLKPLIVEMTYLKTKGKLQNNIDYVKVAQIFDRISKKCKIIELQDFPKRFYKNFKN